MVSKKQSGFTLLELLVVISIISFLANLTFTSVRVARINARDTKRISDIKDIALAMELYYSDYGYFPPETYSDTSRGCSTVAGGVFWNDWDEGNCPVGTTLDVDLAEYISNMPIDPLNEGNYMYVYNAASCGGGGHQCYVIRARLETTGQDHGICGGKLDRSDVPTWITDYCQYGL